MYRDKIEKCYITREYFLCCTVTGNICIVYKEFLYVYKRRRWTVTLGERILILRRRLKMSQSMLARACGLDTNTIARLEQGRVHDLSGEAIIRVARALQVSTDVVLGVGEMDDTSSELIPTGPVLA